MEESWADIPDLQGYEVSTTGRVRKWTTKGGKAQPVTYKGTATGDTVTYTLQGEHFTIDELMRSAFGDEADEMEAMYDPQERDRDLSQYEVNEIKMAEGWKPAFETLAKHAEHYRNTGEYPEDVVVMFRTFAERGKVILLALHELHDKIKAPVIDMNTIEIPDFLPEEL